MSSFFDSTLSRIILAVVLLSVPFIWLRALVAQPFSIPSGSMIPTLMVGDYLVAAKFPYGYSNFSLPFGSYLPAFSIARTPPKRGDVAIFRLPGQLSVNYVMRVVGMSGETVQVKDGITYINGIALRREPIGTYEATGEDDASYEGAPLFREYMPDGASYRVLELAENTNADNTELFQVPAGHYFVMGDNRDNSNDSRFTVGFVPEANIYAKAEVAFSKIDGVPIPRWLH